jgi:hypothetical protein
MKRQIITYILAAFCAAAVFSCNKEAAIDNVGPDSDEYTVLMTAAIDASTKAVSIEGNEVVCTWAIDEEVALVYRDTVISKLKVVSVDGNKAQLSGTVRGSYTAGAEMKLFYGGDFLDNIVYNYTGQDGTITSAVSKAFLQGDTKVLKPRKDANSVDELAKTLTLESTTLHHQQSYMGLVFYLNDKPTDVKSVVITKNGDNIENIVKVRKPLVHVAPDSLSVYDYAHKDFFTVTSGQDYGQHAFYFALSDTTTTILNHMYKLEITTITPPASVLDKPDTTVYYGQVAAPGLSGNYFADFRVNLVRRSPVITAPTVYSHIYYDGLPHNLNTPADVRPGAYAEYAVSEVLDEMPVESAWSRTVPRRMDQGYYAVWYKVNGGNDYESILPTFVGITSIQPMDSTKIYIPDNIAVDSFTYDAESHALLKVGIHPVVKLKETIISGASVQYYAKRDDANPPTGEEAGWSTDVPRGTDAGTYYIWFRYLGDSSKGYLPAKAGPVTVTIGKKPLILTAYDQDKDDIEKTLDKVGEFGMCNNNVLHSIDFTIVGTGDTPAAGDLIKLSNAVIRDTQRGIMVTSNYNITYMDGHVTD